MYFEKHRTFVKREGFVFEFSGAELKITTENLFHEFRAKEMDARNKASDLLKNPKIHHEDKEVIKAKDDIVKYGQLKEKCGVWAYEFDRSPVRKYSLGTNDIAFFRLVEIPYEYHSGNSQRDTWKFTYKGLDLRKPFENVIKKLQEERKGFLKTVKRSVTNQFDDSDEREFQRELCENTILLNQFESNQDKEFHLALGDIVYLDLAPLLAL